MAKINEPRKGIYTFECPGCKVNHVIYTEEADQEISWTFNGDVEEPTFSQSLLVNFYDWKSRQDRVCHSYITKGEIKFLHDSNHKLAGKTVKLKEV